MSNSNKSLSKKLKIIEAYSIFESMEYEDKIGQQILKKIWPFLERIK